jgi:hypothetical protein
MLKFNTSRSIIAGELVIIFCSVMISNSIARAAFDEDLNFIQLAMAGYGPFVFLSSLLLRVFAVLHGNENNILDDKK